MNQRSFLFFFFYNIFLLIKAEYDDISGDTRNETLSAHTPRAHRNFNGVRIV